MLTLLLPLLCAAAPGEAVAVDRTAEVEQGRVLIRDLREEEALAVLEPLTKDVTLPPRLRATAFIYSGIAQLNLAQDAAAKAQFDLALELDPAASVPAWVSRKVRAVFDEVLSARQAEQRRREQLLRASEEVKAQLPPPPRRTRLTLALAGGAVATAIASGALFLTWRSVYAQGQAAESFRESQQLQQRSEVLWYAAEACAGVSVGLAAGAVIAWTVTPTPGGGAAAVVTGSF